jgi:hypothetical protein
MKLSELAIDSRPDGSISIFYHGRQYLREPGGGWSRRRSTANGWKDGSDRHARRLERACRHRDELKPVQRFPRERVQRFPRLKRDPEAEAKKEQIRELWAENQKVQTVNKKNRYELGKALDELHALRAHHGNGTYDRDVETLGIPKPTAWRIRNYYRELAGLAPVSQFVSNETNLPDVTSPSGESGRAAAIMRERAATQKKITQVRLDPERHKIFHKRLKKLAVALGTEGVSETTFKAIATYEVPACAKLP